MKKTYQPKAKDIQRKRHEIDAGGRVLGRLASEIAVILTGKNKPEYAPHLDMGDIVEVKNASKVKLTGQKKDKKVYISHSGYPGGFKEVKFKKMFGENPARVIEIAVRGMLPKNRLQSKRMRRLKVEA